MRKSLCDTRGNVLQILEALPMKQHTFRCMDLKHILKQLDSAFLLSEETMAALHPNEKIITKRLQRTLIQLFIAHEHRESEKIKQFLAESQTRDLDVTISKYPIDRRETFNILAYGRKLEHVSNVLVQIPTIVNHKMLHMSIRVHMRKMRHASQRRKCTGATLLDLLQSSIKLYMV